MNTFDTNFPLTKPLDQIEYRGSFLIKQTEPCLCWHCGAMTPWIDGNFMAALCSPECEDAKWSEFAEAYNKGESE